MDQKAVIRISIIATAAQLALVVAGHLLAPVKGLFGPLGMAISLAAGVFYGLRAPGPWPATLEGGGVCGGLCALIGIGASHLLGDVPAPLIQFGTLASAVAGAAGAAAVKALVRARN